MVDRINLILKAKNLTSRQFAEEIGIQPSGMSHILGGRNRPSLDFVMKVVTRYPEIDIKWLTLGEGEMYVSPYSMPVVQPSAPSPVVSRSEPPASQVTTYTEPDLFSSPEPELPIDQPAPVDEPTPMPLPEPDDVEPSVDPDEHNESQPEAPKPQLDENRLYGLGKPAGAEKQNLRKKRIMKVVILYDDHSFSEYYPE